MEDIRSLERLHEAWKREALEAWDTHKLKSAGLSGTGHSLEDAIQANVATRLLRETRAVSTLGLLIGAWKTHIARGLAVLSSGPGLHSDLRILRECRAISDSESVLESDAGGKGVYDICMGLSRSGHPLIVPSYWYFPRCSQLGRGI